MAGEKKNSFEKLAITIFMLVLIAPTLLWCGVKLIAKADPEVITFFVRDTGENRTLAQLPEVWDMATATTDLEQYYNDRVPFRSLILAVDKKLDWYLDLLYQNRILPAMVSMALGDVEEKEYLPPRVVNGLVVPGREGWLFFAGDDSISYYQATNIMTEQEMEELLSLMQRLQEVCDARGIRLQFMITPNKEQVYFEYMPDYMIYHEEKREQVLVDYITANSEINIIYPLDDLIAGKELYQMYLKYDTHWTRAGGFIGTQALYRELGLETTNLQTLSVVPEDRLTGDLINLAGYDLSVVEGEKEYQIDYHSDHEISYSAGDLLGEGAYITETPGAPYDQHMVLLGDSYRFGMIPYLERDFTSCLFAHVDHLEDTSLYEGIRNADILVVALVERNDIKLTATLEMLLKIYGEEDGE